MLLIFATVTKKVQKEAKSYELPSYGCFILVGSVCPKERNQRAYYLQ